MESGVADMWARCLYAFPFSAVDSGIKSMDPSVRMLHLPVLSRTFESMTRQKAQRSFFFGTGFSSAGGH
jgi:hypothetical protein